MAGWRGVGKTPPLWGGVPPPYGGGYLPKSHQKVTFWGLWGVEIDPYGGVPCLHTTDLGIPKPNFRDGSPPWSRVISCFFILNQRGKNAKTLESGGRFGGGHPPQGGEGGGTPPLGGPIGGSMGGSRGGLGTQKSILQTLVLGSPEGGGPPL